MLEEIPAIRPLSFFSFQHEILYLSKDTPRKKRKKSYLPRLESFSASEEFADVSIGWNEEGVSLCVEVSKPFEEAVFPAVSKGDGLEVFIDTRNQKTKTVTKYCHHFVFLPTEVEGVTAREVTRFRMEDHHELADPSLLFVTSNFKSKSYSMDIHIARDALYGFEPSQMSWVGFTYVLHRKNGAPQGFSASVEDCNIAKHPLLWASCKWEEKI